MGNARRIIGRIVGALIVLGALGIGAYLTNLSYREPRTDDASVRANLVGIAPHVSGPIVELPVVDNQPVRQGQLLFVIDPRPFEVELERATAESLLARSEVDAISHAIASAGAELRRQTVERVHAGKHVERLEPLLADQFVTQDKFEEAQTKWRAAIAAQDQAQRELKRQQSLLAQFGTMNARLKAAEAAVHDAELNLDYCRVRAPFDGRVTNLNLSVGEYARAGRQVFALVDTRAWYVMANFQETYLESIRPGMTADAYLMSYPNRRFRGTVQGIGWATYPETEASIGGLPKVQPTLNWVRLAQRLPVRIRLEDPDPEYPYRMGMTAVVTIRGERSDASQTR